MDYKSFQNALLLGEANYSFTSTFAKEFDGSITATEYGNAESIVNRYFDGHALQLKTFLARLSAESSVKHIMASVDARTLGNDLCMCERWNGQSWDAPSHFWNHPNTMIPFDLVIFNFPHTDKNGKAPRLLRALFKQARICVENGRFTNNVVIELRLRHHNTSMPAYCHHVRAAYKHEEAAAMSQFALIGIYKSDLDHWFKLGYEHRMTRRNANCRGMPCQVWRWCPQQTSVSNDNDDQTAIR